MKYVTDPSPTPPRAASTPRVTNRRIFEWVCAWALLGDPTQAVAQTEWSRLVDMRHLSATEWALLPEYCRYTETYRRPEDTAAYHDWRSRLGPGFDTMHHYCYGIVKAHRAPFAGQSQFRAALLASAVDEIEFVLRGTPSDFIVRPEVLLRGGQFAAKLRDYPRALEYFEASIKSKPDYWPPYVEIANVNLEIRRRQHAVEALKSGLTLMPAQPQLKAALARIEADASMGTREPRTTRP